ncbi:hypothetical protein RI367_005113 [Sorochytrium milnesiophthora]
MITEIAIGAAAGVLVLALTICIWRARKKTSRKKERETLQREQLAQQLQPHMQQASGGPQFAFTFNPDPPHPHPPPHGSRPASKYSRNSMVSHYSGVSQHSSRASINSQLSSGSYTSSDHSSSSMGAGSYISIDGTNYPARLSEHGSLTVETNHPYVVQTVSPIDRRLSNPSLNSLHGTNSISEPSPPRSTAGAKRDQQVLSKRAKGHNKRARKARPLPPLPPPQHSNSLPAQQHYEQAPMQRSISNPPASYEFTFSPAGIQQQQQQSPQQQQFGFSKPVQSPVQQRVPTIYSSGALSGWSAIGAEVVRVPYAVSGVGYGDEISMRIGDQVVIAASYSDGWARGKNLSTGQEGAFPLACFANPDYADFQAYLNYGNETQDSIPPPLPSARSGISAFPASPCLPPAPGDWAAIMPRGDRSRTTSVHSRDASATTFHPLPTTPPATNRPSWNLGVF